MLNQVKRVCVRLGRTTVNGHIIETPNNGPCRNVYGANGFTWDANKWVAGAEQKIADPKWLAIRIDETTKPA
jgi:hypothetical protein